MVGRRGICKNTLIMSLQNKKVWVYFNLHKKLFSIRHKGKVIAHLDKVFLTNAIFKVSEAGRKRVIRDKRKNVHAYVVGNIENGNLKKGLGLTYNPYLFENFVTEIDQKPVRSAKKVMLQVTNKKAKIFAAEIE